MSTPGDPFWRERRSSSDFEWPRPEEPLAPTPPDERPGARPPARRSRSWAAVAWAGLGAVVGGIVAGGVVAVVLQDDDAPGGDALTDSGTGRLIEVVKQDDAIIAVAAAARPSIVRIESSHRTPDGHASDVGSGIILDREGHILTNAHIVLSTETLRVFLSDGSERSAILIGHDAPFTDVAVLRIGPVDLTPLEVGDSEALALGQAVIAIGNPLAEFDGSVTAGVVSGVERRRVIDGVMQPDLIQTDAAVNHGNSGGALLNLAGQLVGIPTIVIRETSSQQPVEGIAFAIPANRAVAVARGIIEANGNYPRPAMGLEHLDITPDVAARFPRLNDDQGALVVTVMASGPAAEAGVAVGDIITEVGGARVDRDNLFLNGLMEQEPGATVRVVLNRGGRIIELDVRLGTRS
ncbi:MAG: trypsin-like peptidase domain-containing protein [Dehalococcoidia bacterium]